MSTEQDRIRSIAERIASRLAGDAGGARPHDSAEEGGELSQLRATLRELQQRLAHVESHVAHGGDCEQHGQTAAPDARGSSSPQQQGPDAGVRQPSGAARQPNAPQQSNAPQQFLSSTYIPAAHPSQERFGIDDAVSELVDFFEREKVCSVEPGGKPCDHCAMCSSRGF